MPYTFVVQKAGEVCGRAVQPGDVITVAAREGRIALAIELPNNVGAVLGAMEDGLLEPIAIPRAEIAAQLRPPREVRARRPATRVLPFPVPAPLSREA